MLFRVKKHVTSSEAHEAERDSFLNLGKAGIAYEASVYVFLWF
jgi:hypothetical protein